MKIDLSRPAWVAPLKLNVWALAAAISWIVWICVEAQTGIVEQALPKLLTSGIADEVRTAALHLLATVAGVAVANIAIAGLVSWGIKLLDDRADPEPTMPAATHERVVARILAAQGGEAELRGLEAEAGKQQGETP